MAGLLKNVSKDHPRVLGSREYLQRIARERPEAYARVVNVARKLKFTEGHDDHGMRGRLMALNLVSAIEGDAQLGREAAAIVRRVFLDKPVRVGHVSFGIDCGQLALTYDLCHDYWESADRARYFAYLKEAREKNIGEETSVFHNGWYGMKSAGFILSCLATVHENPYAETLFEEIDREFHARAVPALKLCGEGGGFGEGYYTQYWIYDWIVAIHCLNVCAGIDYFAAAPEFHRNRAVAGMFEFYPTLREGGSRRAVACGDSGGRHLHPERDKSLNALRILVNHHRDDAAHQAVHAFALRTPRASFDFGAYRDFLWLDPSVKPADLNAFKLSHCSPGPGNVNSRGSWGEDAAYLFFHCGRRFTTHQHLDMNHFALFKYEELLGDGGEYATWNGPHIVNYYVRTIAHNSMLIHDPSEKFPAGIRGGGEAANDGGQAVRWIGTPWLGGGDGFNVEQWKKFPEIGDTGAIIAYEERGDYMHCAGDATKAYSSSKLDWFTRQIVHLRPDTFVVFDRVRAKQPHFKKTMLLHAMSRPGRNGEHWLVTNGYGRLFIQTLLPANAAVRVLSGEEQFNYDGQSCPPTFRHGSGPDSRIEISPSVPSNEDFFLHVFTTLDYNVTQIPPASVRVEGDDVIVSVNGATIVFKKSTVAATVRTR